jgi:hypothetical protein
MEEREMNEVKINVNNMLAKLKENREKHLNIYEDAFLGWKMEWIKKLEKCLELAEGNDDNYWDSKEAGYFYLSKPKHYLEDYDQAITMLELCVEKEMVVTSEDIRHFVRDEWSWKGEFDLVCSGYTTRS